MPKITYVASALNARPAFPARRTNGYAQILREVAGVCAELDPSTRPEWIVKRMQFFGYDVASKAPVERPVRDKIAFLNRWFFDQKRFQALSDNGCVAERITLHTVLAKRVGSPVAVGLLYAFLAQQIGVELEFANVQPAGFLKFFEHGLGRYIDVARGGKILESDEVLDTLHARLGRGRPGFSDADLLEVIPHDRLFVEYLNALRMAYRMRESVEPLLVIQNWLVAYQPSNVQALGERALLHRRLGHYKSALSDLKRYFSFMERDRAPSELPRAYDELLAMFGSKLPPRPPVGGLMDGELRE